jgi:glucose-1-phosphate cytidylyltransferase
MPIWLKQKLFLKTTLKRGLSVYMLDGLWHPMDNLRDKGYLESFWENRNARWKQWQD